LLYQTLLGAWPPEPLSDENDWKTFGERIEANMLKAIREAKRNTSWINRNTEYEAAVSSFVKALLDREAKNRFLDDFVPFQRRVARFGLWNSLSQTLLKLTCPGVPDIYQGNELWDFSLVDPDNRRPVDYVRRQQMFEGVRSGDGARSATSISVNRLLETPEDGRIKLYTIWRTLCLRQQQSELFQQGEYLPLAVAGSKADHVIAFARKFENTSVVVVVPRLVASLVNGVHTDSHSDVDTDLAPIGAPIWEDTHVLLPCACREECRNVFTGKALELTKSDGHTKVNVSAALAEFPVALCVLG
jgi:(1->4)-alpha-D-glucan 1-alpha-D-glucosylmutase